MKRLLFCLYEFYVYVFLNRFVFRWIPFWYIRRLFVLPLAKGIGHHSQIDMDCFFFEPRRFKCGKHTHINRNCIIDSRGGIEIGDCCSISFNCKLVTGYHKIQSQDFEYIAKPITISDYVHIGVDATVLANVNIGYGAVVAAGAVVTKDVPDYAIVGGVPAKVIGYREKDFRYKPLEEGFNWPMWR